MLARRHAPLLCHVLLAGCGRELEVPPQSVEPAPVAGPTYNTADGPVAPAVKADDPVAAPPGGRPPRRAPPTVKSRFSTASGGIVAQTTVENENGLNIVGFYGATGNVYVEDQLDGEQKLLVVDGSGAQKELKRWPGGYLQQLHVGSGGEITAVVVEYNVGLLIERFDPAGKALGAQKITGKYEAVIVATGSDDPAIIQRSGIGRAGPGEVLSKGAPLSFEPRSAAFDSQGALVVVGVANRGGAPTAKFSPELQPLWERRYERPGEEQADLVIVGPDDRVCSGGITETVPIDGPGSHHGEGYATDVWIRCYTAAGKLLWDGRYNAEKSPSHDKRFEQDHTISSMVLVPDGGIVFVGSSSSASTWIQKVSDRGSAEWWVEIEDVRGAWIAVTQNGHIQVAGKLAHSVTSRHQWIWRAELAPQ